MSISDVRSRILSDNRNLPEHLRGSIVLLEFSEPIPRAAAFHFLRVRLTSEMRDDGEDEFYRIEAVQPHRAGQRPCRACDTPRRQFSKTEQVCENTRCSLFGIRVECGPLSGVLNILVAEDFIVDGDRLNRLGLILDRRYNDRVLAGVYRAAGQLCDELGWRLA